MTNGREAERVREPRFPLVVPMVYRHTREEEWHPGTTINVSGSGTLFVGPQSLQAGTPVELRLALHGFMPGRAPGNFRCIARIIRVASAAAEPSGSMMAAQFDDYRFEHTPTVD